MRDVRITGWASGTPVARVRAALMFKGIPFEDQASEDATEYCASVPVLLLTLDGRSLRIPQSLAIINFLEEVFPDPSVLPKDIANRARARTLLNMMVCDLQPRLDAFPEGRQDIWYHVLHEADRLCDTKGYAVGDTLSIADICIVPELRRSVAANQSLANYPNLKRILAVAGEHSAFEY